MRQSAGEPQLLSDLQFLDASDSIHMPYQRTELQQVQTNAVGGSIVYQVGIYLSLW